MFPLLRLVAAIAAQNAAEKARQTARRSALYAVTALLVLVGGGFLVAAGWILLERHYGNMAATLICAGIFFVLALVVFTVARYRPRRRAGGGMDGQTFAAMQAQAAANAAQAAAQARAGYAKSPALPLVGAFAVGLLIAIRLRR